MIGGLKQTTSRLAIAAAAGLFTGGIALSWAVGRIGSLGTLDLRLSGDALAWNYSEFGSPELSPSSEAELMPLGWIYGTVVQFGLEIRP